MVCLVWNSVRSRKNIVNNASSFTKAAGTRHVKVVEVKPYEIDEINKALGVQRSWSNPGDS